MIQSVDRALQILDLLKIHSRGLGVTEIANQLNVAKSTAHRLLMSLEGYDYVQKVGKDSSYRLGLKFLEMNQAVVENLNVVEIARPFLEKLSSDTGEIVHLVMLDEHEIVYIDKVDNASTIRIYSQIGKRGPLYCTGVGKAILSHFDQGKMAEYFEQNSLKKFTEHTLTDAEYLQNELKTIRTASFAYDNEEHEVGIKCVAAPILDHRHQVDYAISVTGPIARMFHEKLDEIIPRLKETAQQISRQLGYVK